MSDRLETLGSVINDAIEYGLRDLYTLIPAKVVKWDAAKQRANCQILIKNVTRDESGDRQVDSCPVVPGVPVQFLGAGTFRITCPISDGSLVIGGSTIPATTGSLIFSHRSLDKWLTGDGKEVDPEFDHAHALTDAVFLPGLMPFGGAWGTCPTDAMTIGSDGDGNARIVIKSGEIDLGDGASKGVARKGDKVKGDTQMLAWLSAVSTLLNTAGPVVGAPGTVTNPVDFGVVNEGSAHIKAID